MQITCGVDLVEYGTFGRYLKLGRERLLQRIYTPLEQVYCESRIPCLAAKFAVKEAVAKALGTGIRGIELLEIETVNDEVGKPYLHLVGRVASKAEQMQLTDWNISLTHAEHYAVAIAIALRQGITLRTDLNTPAALTASLVQPNACETLQELLNDLESSDAFEGRT